MPTVSLSSSSRGTDVRSEQSLFRLIAIARRHLKASTILAVLAISSYSFVRIMYSDNSSNSSSNRNMIEVGKTGNPSLLRPSSSTEPASSSSSFSPCTVEGRAQVGVGSDKIVIDFASVSAMTKDRLSQLKHFTVEWYEDYFMDVPGKEHYTLMEYLTKTFVGDSCHHHVVDIGTRYVASALALGSNGHKVMTFDLPNSKERQSAFRGKSEDEWQDAVRAAGVNIQFNNVNLLDVTDEDFNTYMSTWLISLDTFHEPYSHPFEREFFKRLAESGYRGVLILDDIHLNDEMKRWWAELQDNAQSMNYRTFDLTKIGHATGTACVDFSGKVELLSS